MGVFTMSENEKRVTKDEIDVDFVIDVLLLIRKHDLSEEIFWDEKLEFFVICNDFFYWACSDCERLTRENLPQLLEAMQEVEALGLNGWQYGPLLFCARQRKMRPQIPYYEHIHQDLHALFDACGGPQGDRG